MIELEFHDSTENLTLNLNHVLFVPEIKKSLLSVAAMTQMEAEVVFLKIKAENTVNVGHLQDNKLTKPGFVTPTPIASLRQLHSRYGELWLNQQSSTRKMMKG